MVFNPQDESTVVNLTYQKTKTNYFPVGSSIYMGKQERK